jgi:hypothetical protein
MSERASKRSSETAIDRLAIWAGWITSVCALIAALVIHPDDSYPELGMTSHRCLALGGCLALMTCFSRPALGGPITGLAVVASLWLLSNGNDPLSLVLRPYLCTEAASAILERIHPYSSAKSQLDPTDALKVIQSTSSASVSRVLGWSSSSRGGCRFLIRRRGLICLEHRMLAPVNGLAVPLDPGESWPE